MPQHHTNSYRQARSLQAHALQWHQDQQSPQSTDHDNHHEADGKTTRSSSSSSSSPSPSSSQSPTPTPLLYYYTLDFRGEPSALHGAVLERQAAFVRRALEAIAWRHRDVYGGGEEEGLVGGGKGGRRVSVLVVAHSYGGMVAKGGVAGVLRDADKHVVEVPVLVTLGAPHQRCVWVGGWSMNMVDTVDTGA